MKYYTYGLRMKQKYVSGGFSNYMTYQFPKEYYPICRLWKVMSGAMVFPYNGEDIKVFNNLIYSYSWMNFYFSIKFIF